MRIWRGQPTHFIYETISDYLFIRFEDIVLEDIGLPITGDIAEDFIKSHFILQSQNPFKECFSKTHSEHFFAKLSYWEFEGQPTHFIYETNSDYLFIRFEDIALEGIGLPITCNKIWKYTAILHQRPFHTAISKPILRVFIQNSLSPLFGQIELLKIWRGKPTHFIYERKSYYLFIRFEDIALEDFFFFAQRGAKKLKIHSHTSSEAISYCNLITHLKSVFPKLTQPTFWLNWVIENLERTHSFHLWNK